WRGFFVRTRPIDPAALPDLPVAFCPIGHLFQGTCFDSAPSQLRVPSPRDQSRAFQYTKVFGNRGHSCAIRCTIKPRMKLYTYLNYSGNCAQAFRFYEEYLGAKIIMMMTLGQQPNPQGVPPDRKDA